MSASVTGAIDVPKLALRAWRGGKHRRGAIHYESAEHRDVPHVVKFSGGRSSGLMLLILLENHLLKPERGDVVLFTNTSAEHPATYDFVRKMKSATEKAGIPFFIAQLHTFETVVRGEWRRCRSYRLASARPFSDKHPWGYSNRGEVFEEAIVSTGMLPSVHTRICTTLMKMLVTREFLSDWFGGTAGIRQQGHQSTIPQVDSEPLYREHIKNKGKMSKEEFQKRYDILSQRLSYRPAQKFRDYTRARLVPHYNDMLMQSVYGGKCELFGDRAAKFITFLGFRAGEDARYQRMMQRNHGEATPGHDTQPPGEVSFAPLFDLRIDQAKVFRFWEKQPVRLRPRLPESINLSNCVYCFLKGSRALSQIEREKQAFEKTLPQAIRKECDDSTTPNSIDWWIRFEDAHKRQAKKKHANGKEARTFGMFGLKDMDYRLVKAHTLDDSSGKSSDQLQPTLNCECTD